LARRRLEELKAQLKGTLPAIEEIEAGLTKPEPAANEQD
jgi:hypothetical protein